MRNRTKKVFPIAGFELIKRCHCSTRIISLDKIIDCTIGGGRLDRNHFPSLYVYESLDFLFPFFPFQFLCFFLFLSLQVPTSLFT